MSEPKMEAKTVEGSARYRPRVEPQWSARLRPLALVLVCVFGLLYAATAVSYCADPEG